MAALGLSILLGVMLAMLPAGSVGAQESILIPVPYRSQLDGSPYQGANCGPNTVGMVLAAFGIQVSSWDLRVEAMKLQGTWGEEYRDEWGVFIYHLATLVEQHGLYSMGLYQLEGGRKADTIRAWELEDLRFHLRQGHPVVVEVRFNALPGREDVRTGSDHYIVVHGSAGDRFVYSDGYPAKGGGPMRTISGDVLLRAMERSAAPRAAFAVSGPAGG